LEPGAGKYWLFRQFFAETQERTKSTVPTIPEDAVDQAVFCTITSGLYLYPNAAVYTSGVNF
jgi:hypothetical protein